MAVAIVTDSASSIPPELAAAHDITVVPLQLAIGDDTYLDGEVPQQVLLERIRAGVPVTTSAPSPGAFEAAINERMTADGVLVLTIASTMSATHKAALVAARLVDGPVRVVDTRTAAGAQGLVVLQAARAAAAGGTLEEVTTIAEQAAAQVRLVATVGSLEFLARSGRVPVLAGRAADALGVRPVFEFRDGQARPLWPSFSRDASVQRILELWRQSRVEGAALHVAALHAVAEPEAQALLAQVRAEVEPATAFVGEFTTVMVVHTGPGIIGLAWLWEQSAEGLTPPTR